jgi:Protein of unknown function (DUF3037)
MSKAQGLYALIQFSAAPERFEFINIGVLLIDAERRFFGARFAQNSRRLDRAFGPQSKPYLDAIKVGINNRLKAEIGADWNIGRLQSFARSRANGIRISKLLPIAVEDDPEAILMELFHSLVGDEEIVHRLPKVTAELRKKFERAGVDKLVEKPRPIDLPQGITIEAPYAYQNGSYNLIEPVRLRGPATDALAQASKRAVQGKWLHDYSAQSGRPARLVVVGEVAGQDPSFVHALKEMMVDHSVRFYDMKNIDPLVQDIKLHRFAHVD